MILLTNPKASYHAHKKNIDFVINNALESGWYILGDNVREFENEFAAYLGLQHATGVANGTDAIEIALRAYGIGNGDIVITTSHTAVATVAAIERAGALPFFIDIDPETYTISTTALEDAIKKNEKTNLFSRIKAIIPVHLYGHPADMDAIMEIATHYGLVVIEDCAQSHGSEYKGKKTGSMGHVGAFSFYPTKNLGGFGDGGMVVTNDKKINDKLKALRQYGWKKKNIANFQGINSRLDEIQAAILKVKLKTLDKENQKRIETANQYSKIINGSIINPPIVQHQCKHVFHLYVVKTFHRNDLINYLKNHNIMSDIHYPIPVHLQPAYKGRILVDKGNLSVTEKICNQIISLPMHPFLKSEELDYICNILEKWIIDNR